jgi:lipopolysaccharide transport system ATP-binding protein
MSFKVGLNTDKKNTQENSSEIVVEGLGKKYKRFPNHWARLAEYFSAAQYCGHKPIWVLRNINFKVHAGESVGIIGQNGAGKSTLLKILAGTTKPSEGTVKLSRNIAALLELGLGFHPDFTGRENVNMSCQMMGHRAEEIIGLIPEIEKFSELGEYFDQPLRVYSTGMQMRLAFSAVTVTRPEVLIVDEALAVGDAYFQHKCMQRIRAFKKEGTTLLFVSHDPGAVKSLCDRALLFDKGRLFKDDSPDVVLDYYNAMIAKKKGDEEIKQVENELGKTVTRSGSGQVRIQKVDVLDEENRSVRAFSVGDTITICCYLQFHADIKNPTIGFIIRDRLGNDVFGTNTYYLNIGEHAYKKRDHVCFKFTMKLNIGTGNYSLCVAVHSGYEHIEKSYDWWDQCMVFQVIPNNSFTFVGSAALPVEVDIQGMQ